MRHALLWGMVCFFASCAQQQAPMGGPVDEKAPLPISIIPAPLSTQFQSNRIEIEFDEYVRLQSVKEQVLISPPMDPMPEFSLKNNKKLLIDLKDIPLHENTTYTINFGKAIVDNNEGNVLEENVYLFSTGSYIDSLALAGQASMALSGEACADCLAALYAMPKDSSLLGRNPLYVSSSDENGYFQFDFLADDDYRLLVFRDENANLEWNEEEPLGFVDSLIRPQNEIDSLYLTRLFQSEKLSPELKTIEWNRQGTSLLVAWEGISTSDSLLIPDSLRIAYREELDQDSIRYWFRERLDAEVLLVHQLDEKRDTLRKGRFDEQELPPLEFYIEEGLSDSLLKITLNRPLGAKPDTQLIAIYRDSVAVPYQLDAGPRHFELHNTWEAGDYVLEVLPDACQDIYGQSNDTSYLSIELPAKESLSILQFELKADSVPLLMQLLDHQDLVKEEARFKGSDIWRIEDLQPGLYRLRAIEDRDGNGQWTTGSLEEFRQPEAVFYYPLPINARANWELEQEVNITFSP